MSSGKTRRQSRSRYWAAILILAACARPPASVPRAVKGLSLPLEVSGKTAFERAEAQFLALRSAGVRAPRPGAQYRLSVSWTRMLASVGDIDFDDAVPGLLLSADAEQESEVDCPPEMGRATALADLGPEFAGWLAVADLHLGRKTTASLQGSSVNVVSSSDAIGQYRSVVRQSGMFSIAGTVTCMVEFKRFVLSDPDNSPATRAAAQWQKQTAEGQADKLYRLGVSTSRGEATWGHEEEKGRWRLIVHRSVETPDTEGGERVEQTLVCHSAKRLFIRELEGVAVQVFRSREGWTACAALRAVDTPPAPAQAVPLGFAGQGRPD